jgi:hypothetical protein
MLCCPPPPLFFFFFFNSYLLLTMMDNPSANPARPGPRAMAISWSSASYGVMEKKLALRCKLPAEQQGACRLVFRKKKKKGKKKKKKLHLEGLEPFF